MNPKKTVLMLIFLVVGAIFVLRYEQTEEKKRESDEAAVAQKKQNPKLVLPGITSKDLVGFGVVHTDDSYNLMWQEAAEDRKEGWVLKKPEGAPVDPKALEHLLVAVDSLSATSTIEAAEVEEDQSVYGLVPPELLLTLKTSAGDTRVISFGKKSLSGKRYAQLEGNPGIFLIDDSVFTLLNKKRDEVRIRRPLNFSPQQVSSFGVVRPGATTLVFKKAFAGGSDAAKGRSWTISGAQGDIDGDVKLIDQELHRLSRLVVKRFVDEAGENLALYGLVRPEIVLSLYLDTEDAGDKKEETSNRRELLIQIGRGVRVDTDAESNMAFGKIAYFFKVTGEPWVYEANGPAFSAWLQGVDYFRNRTLIAGLETCEIDRIECKYGPGLLDRFVLSRSSDGQSSWFFEGATQGKETNQVPVMPEKIQLWLAELKQIQVISYPGLASDAAESYGFSRPQMLLKFHTAADKEYELLLGKRLQQAAVSGQGAEELSPQYAQYTKPVGDPLPLVISGADLPLLERKPEYFLGRAEGR